MSVSPAIRAARAYLSYVAEPPAPALAQFVRLLGPVQAAERVRRADAPTPVLAETAARRDRDRAVAHLRAAEAIGARLLVPEDADWPAGPLLALQRAPHEHLVAPLALWVRGPGRLGELVERSVAIVGSRAASPYGQHVAHTLGFGVSELGATVISGAALGIDGSAHRGALAAEGPTVAVLARGVDRAYPVAHERLLGRIARNGLVISEYPPGAVPARHRFLVRNRLIAALAAGTVVVEAGWRSGARRTASDAALLGRPVMAVPGPITSAMSVGCHRLLREPGTIAVTTAEEVLEEVGRIGADLAPERPGSEPARPTDGLPGPVLRVYDAFVGPAVRDAARLSVESGLPVEVVRAALPRLARAGLVERAEGGWRRSPPPSWPCAQ